MPLPNTYGMGAYVLSLMRFLRQSGCDIEYLVLGIANNLPGWWVPAELDEVGQVIARRGVRLGPHILVSLSQPKRWLAAPTRFAYLNYLPEPIRDEFRKWKRRIGPASDGLRAKSRKRLPAPIALPTASEVAFVLERCIAIKPDVVIVTHAWLADLFRRLPETICALRVVLAPDILHQRKADFEARGLPSGFGDWDQEIERDCLKNAEVILAIQEQDADMLRQMLPQREVICAPIATSVQAQSGLDQVPGRCLFVGSYVDHNIVGLHWLLESVWPTILARDPQTTLHVCGEVCKSVSGQFRQVQLQGQVENLDNEYGAAEICLVPLHVGSGLKIKLVQALSYGRACVSTSVGARGLPDIDQAGVLVADAPADFAQAVHELLNNAARRAHMQVQAQEYVRARFAPEVVFTSFARRITEHVQQRATAGGH